MITLLTKLLLTKLLINFIVNYLVCNSLCKLVIRKNSNLRTKTTKQILIVSSAFLVIAKLFYNGNGGKAIQLCSHLY